MKNGVVRDTTFITGWARDIFGFLKFPIQCPLVLTVTVVSGQGRELTSRYAKVMSS